jgi:tRNA(adenine34) deaminase
LDFETEVDRRFMCEALEEAKRAFDKGEVPVGAVLVIDNVVVARAHNLVESLSDATAHAELLCLRKGAEILNNWRLLDATLYCTLEPCPMCAGAMIHSRLHRLVWGAPDLRCGAHGSWVNLLDASHPIHQLKTTTGLMKEECADVMRSFFKWTRKTDRKYGNCI